MKIYLAGPLFSTAERDFNSRLAFLLRGMGHEVFLPQEHEVQQGSPLAIFIADRGGIDWCEVIVANLDGPDPDSGTCWELGYAYAKKKLSLAYRTDARLYEGQDKVNVMMTESVDTMLFQPNETVEQLAKRVDYWIVRKHNERERSDKT